jgi:RNA polymerase sigma factor (sigma-70 family)
MTVQEYNQSVDQFADRILRFVAKNVRDHHFAEDIVQDCYEKLWKNIAQVNGEKVKAYLFTTAYHVMIDRLRKEKRMTVTKEIPFAQEGPSGQYSDIGEHLNKAVNRLPEIQRIVTLRDYEGYSYGEIGEMTGLNESQVKVYIYRARIFLKNYIGKTDVLV